MVSEMMMETDLLTVGALEVIILLLLLLLFGIAFAGIGTKLYGGFVQSSGNDTYPALSVTTFGESHYYVLNFNDVFMSMGTLFTLLMVNNMDITSQGIEESSKGNYSRIFFVCWYIVGVLFTLNLFLAVLLNTLGSFLFSRQVKAMTQSGTTPPDQPNPTAASTIPISNGADTNGATVSPITNKLSISASGNIQSSPHPHLSEQSTDQCTADVEQNVMSQISMAAGQSRVGRGSLHQASAFFEDDLYHGLVVGRIEASSLAMHVPISSSLSSIPGAHLMAVADTMESNDPSRLTTVTLPPRDDSESDMTASTMAGSFLAVTLDNSSDHRGSSLISDDDERSNDSKSEAARPVSEGIGRSSTGDRKSAITDLSMHRIPAFLANGLLTSTQGSHGAQYQDASYLNVI